VTLYIIPPNLVNRQPEIHSLGVFFPLKFLSKVLQRRKQIVPLGYFAHVEYVSNLFGCKGLVLMHHFSSTVKRQL
jgi:hypothetical protein